ncbi:hypothetical protein ACFY2J_08160 [Streptomyces collinus]|uniref:hypothetical protein n=1 Tax=Streptomyces collinus TaxID=42684 RepID=UPI0036CDE088
MSTVPPPQTQQEPGPLLTLRTTVILLTAAIIGLVVGGLTFLSARSTAGAVLAGLTSFGVSVPVLHKLIG